MNKSIHATKYIIFDFLAAAIGWTLFYVYRKTFIEPKRFGIDIPVEFTTQFYLALLILPFVWIAFYYVTGYYKSIYRPSRLKEFGNTFMTSLSGVVVIFFTLILDDYIESYKNYYQLFYTLFALHFGITYIFRLTITARIVHKIHKREIGFNTLIIGCNKSAVKAYSEMTQQVRPRGNKFVGFVCINNGNDDILKQHIPNLGEISDLASIMEKYEIEEVIIAIETTEHKQLSEILTIIQNRQITVWGIPDLYDFLSGMVKTSSIYGTPLIKISNGLMPGWQENMKRLLDVLLSVISLFVFLPVFAVLAIIIKATSRGPVLYRQERVGRFGRPFSIYKLRSMVADAENGTPKLSSTCDGRITQIGKFLRKTHLDEIPQFINVIRGDMSLVGPRPERKYYIDQIVEKAPHYTHLHKLRPGITSWGQVKYGYASNVNEMLERLPFDMMYLKNISIYIDFKILIYTLMVSFKGNGK